MLKFGLCSNKLAIWIFCRVYLVIYIVTKW